MKTLTLEFLTSQLVSSRILMKNNTLLCFRDALIALKEVRGHGELFIDQVVSLVRLMQVSSATSAAGERTCSK